MAQMAALVTEFAERHAGDVASMADSMQTQLRSRQGTMQTAFGQLDAHRDTAVAELKVSTLLNSGCKYPMQMQYQDLDDAFHTLQLGYSEQQPQHLAETHLAIGLASGLATIMSTGQRCCAGERSRHG